MRNQPTRRGPTLRNWHGRHRRTGARLATVALALTLGAIVTVTLDGAAARLDALGPSRQAWMATRSLEPGHVVQADDARLTTVPAALVPAGVAGPDAVVIGRTVHERIEAGEGVVEGRLAPADLVGVASRTPAGRWAMAVPLDDRAPPLTAGQRVDLYAGAARDLGDIGATGDIGSGTGGVATARLIARDAVVVDIDDRRATVAVGNADAPVVAAALIESTIVIAVAGPDGGGEGDGDR